MILGMNVLVLLTRVRIPKMKVHAYTGDSLKVLKRFDACQFHTCVTSPPYLGLRSYGSIAGQLGEESAPEEFIRHLVDIFREIHRVLRVDGTVWLNLGDSYGSSCKKVRTDLHKYKQGEHLAQGMVRNVNLISDVPPKNLLGIPWRCALALQADGWILRQDIIWQKTAPMPEPVKDRCVSSHEHIFLLSKSSKYYFDYRSIQEAAYGGKGDRRNKRDVWSFAAKYGEKGSKHLAKFPPALAIPCIKAGCPEGGLVLDPFAGSGTSGMVASALGRNCVLIDINPAYKKQQKYKVGKAFVDGDAK